MWNFFFLNFNSFLFVWYTISIEFSFFLREILNNFSYYFAPSDSCFIKAALITFEFGLKVVSFTKVGATASEIAGILF